MSEVGQEEEMVEFWEDIEGEAESEGGDEAMEELLAQALLAQAKFIAMVAFTFLLPGIRDCDNFWQTSPHAA